MPFTPEERLGRPLQYGVWFRGQAIGRQYEELNQLSDGTWQLQWQFQIDTISRGSVIKVDESTEMRFAAQAPYPLISLSWSKTQENKTERVIAKQNDSGLHGDYWNGEVKTSINKAPIEFGLMDHLSLAQFTRAKNRSEPLLWRQIRFPDLTLDVHTLTVQQQGSRWWFSPWIFKQAASNSVPELTLSVSSSGVLMGMQMGANWTVALEPSSGGASTNRIVENVSEQHAKQDTYWQASVRSDKTVGSARRVSSLQMRWPQHIALPLSHTAQQYTVPGLISTDIKQDSEKASPFDVQASLAHEPRYALDNDKILRLAHQLTAQVEDPDKKVQRLLLFVSEHLKQQDVFDEQNAAEILATAKGDCTEFVQLFVALARAVNIPAREVSGWVYLGDETQRFGGHAWAEVAIDGRWISADPMWNLMPVTGTHLRMGDGETGAIAIAQAPTNFEFTVERVSYQ